jgi:hypothetical protein
LRPQSEDRRNASNSCNSYKHIPKRDYVNKMSKISHVCVLCSQDFTRKWTGKRHNQNIHFGQSKIVRLVDYMVGRISGQYFPANPLEFRSRGGERSRFFSQWKKHGFSTNLPEYDYEYLLKDRQYKSWFEETNKSSEMTRSKRLCEIRALIELSCKSVQEAESIFAGVSLLNDYHLNDYLKCLRDLLHIRGRLY